MSTKQKRNNKYAARRLANAINNDLHPVMRKIYHLEDRLEDPEILKTHAKARIHITAAMLEIEKISA